RRRETCGDRVWLSVVDVFLRTHANSTTHTHREHIRKSIYTYSHNNQHTHTYCAHQHTHTHTHTTTHTHTHTHTHKNTHRYEPCSLTRARGPQEQTNSEKDGPPSAAHPGHGWTGVSVSRASSLW